MATSETFADEILNLFNNAAGAAKDGCFVSLHTADPGVTGASEVVGNGYVRQAVNAANWSAPTGVAGTNRHIENGSIITFPTATGAGFGTVTHLGFWSASTVGTFYNGGALTTGKAVPLDAVASFGTGNCRMQVD